jgi:hypothetical protein
MEHALVARSFNQGHGETRGPLPMTKMYVCGVFSSEATEWAVTRERFVDWRQPVSFWCSASFCAALTQLRVLGLSLLQDGDVGVGVFPKGEEIVVSR